MGCWNTVSKYTLRQKGVVLVLILTQFCTFSSYSLLGPFYPEEAFERGVSTSVQGVVIGAFAAGQVLFSPICGKLMGKYGCRRMITVGLASSGAFTIIFGSLTYLPVPSHSYPYLYVALNILGRFGSSVGGGACITGTLTLAAQEFPEDSLFFVGLCESANAIAVALGPAIGGAFYQFGGYFLPFVVMGVLSIATAVLSYWTVPAKGSSTSSEVNDPVNMMPFYLEPRTFIIQLSIYMSGMYICVFFPTLVPYLARMNLEAWQVGMFFTLYAMAYALTAPFVSLWIKRTADSKYIIMFGNLLTAVIMLAMGPSPFFGLGSSFRSLWLILPCLAASGIAQAIMFIPTFHQHLDLLEKKGLPNNSETFGTIAGIWNAAGALGDCFGAMIAGVLYDNVGFQWMLTVYCFIILAMMGLMGLLVVYENTVKKKEWQEQSIHRKETQPLLTDKDIFSTSSLGLTAED